MPKAKKQPAKKSRSAKKVADFIYEHPPLIEVIVEFHWKLQRLQSIQGEFDPFYQEFVERFRSNVRTKGFPEEEFVIPPDVPIELVGNQVAKRFRVGRGEWPLFQIGPGVMTINTVPKYDGWQNFAPTIRTGLDVFFSSYPTEKSIPEIGNLQLRYVNAFDSSFGMDDPGAYVRDKLGLGVQIPAGLLDHKQDDAPEPVHEGTLAMMLQHPKGACGVLSWKQGHRDNKPAIVVEINVRSLEQQPSATSGAMSRWLNKAHAVVHSWFDAMVTPEVKPLLGKRTPAAKKR